MRFLGLDAVSHDPAAAPTGSGTVAAEGERCGGHGRTAVPAAPQTPAPGGGPLPTRLPERSAARTARPGGAPTPDRVEGGAWLP